MNPRLILGKKFEDIGDTISHGGIERVFDELEEGEEQDYSVSSSDGSWEISLGENHKIETIFLYDVCRYSNLIGINKYSTKEQVKALYGEPTKTGEPTNSEYLGKSGAWLRYDFDDHCMHIEYEVESNAIKMVTIMLPKVAP